MKRITQKLLPALLLLMPMLTFGSEADLKIPESIKEAHILYYGFIVTILGLLFGLYKFMKVKKLPAHKSMLDIAEVIYQTCRAYLKQQGKFLAILFLFIGAAVAGYFGFLSPIGETPAARFGSVALIITWTIIGILGSYAVACLLYTSPSPRD